MLYIIYYYDITVLSSYNCLHQFVIYLHTNKHLLPIFYTCIVYLCTIMYVIGYTYAIQLYPTLNILSWSSKDCTSNISPQQQQVGHNSDLYTYNSYTNNMGTTNNNLHIQQQQRQQRQQQQSQSGGHNSDLSQLQSGGILECSPFSNDSLFIITLGYILITCIFLPFGLGKLDGY